MLVGQHCDEAAHSVRDETCARTQIGEVFRYDCVTAIRIKPIFENGDLERSVQKSGVLEGTFRVSVAAHALSFQTEVFGAGVADGEPRKQKSRLPHLGEVHRKAHLGQSLVPFTESLIT